MRYRVIQYVITPTVVGDDGETLTPLGLEPIVVPANDIDTFGERFRTELEARSVEDEAVG